MKSLGICFNIRRENENNPLPQNSLSLAIQRDENQFPADVENRVSPAVSRSIRAAVCGSACMLSGVFMNLLPRLRARYLRVGERVRGDSHPLARGRAMAIRAKSDSIRQGISAHVLVA